MNTIRSARYSTDKLSRKLPVKDNLASIHDVPRTIRETGPENPADSSPRCPGGPFTAPGGTFREDDQKKGPDRFLKAAAARDRPAVVPFAVLASF